LSRHEKTRICRTEREGRHDRAFFTQKEPKRAKTPKKTSGLQLRGDSTSQPRGLREVSNKKMERGVLGDMPIDGTVEQQGAPSQGMVSGRRKPSEGRGSCPDEGRGKTCKTVQRKPAECPTVGDKGKEKRGQKMLLKKTRQKETV